MQRRRNAEVIVETLDLEGKRVVDVGCGDGNLTRMMAKHGASVIGVECSPRQLAKAWKADKVADERVVEGVGQALPVEDGSADIVVFFNSLHHIPAEHMAQALAEAHRVLVPGGMVYVSEPVAEGKFFETCRPVDDETQVRALALASLRQAQGFQMKDEILYLHTVSMKSYEAFRDRIISANHEREERFVALDEQMRALYAANGRPNGDGGMEFDQPMRVNLLVKG